MGYGAPFVTPTGLSMMLESFADSLDFWMEGRSLVPSMDQDQDQPGCTMFVAMGMRNQFGLVLIAVLMSAIPLAEIINMMPASIAQTQVGTLKKKKIILK